MCKEGGWICKRGRNGRKNVEIRRIASGEEKRRKGEKENKRRKEGREFENRDII